MTQYKTLILTVPHTGTHFAMKFLVQNNLVKTQDWFRYHSPWIKNKPAPKQAYHINFSAGIGAPKLIVAARDPYLSGIRWLQEDNRSLEQLSYSWKHLFDIMGERSNYFVLDIGCREKDRIQHLTDLVAYLEIDYNARVVEDFATAWKPENSSNTGAKSSYLNSGALPAADWQLLDDAVAWYKALPTNDFDK